MTKMGFNSHKSWHVNSKGNRDKLEKHEQRNDEKGAVAAERRREREKERDFEETQRLASKYHNQLKSERALDFMYQPPPGMPKEEDEKKEEEIPDIPENKEVRDFLKNAPTKGLWMPLGKEVKVMQCWRCKNYGHRTGDKECPLAQMGNSQAENERLAREDPMSMYLSGQKQKEERNLQKLERLQQLKDLLAKAEKRHMKKKLKRKMRKDEEKKKARRKERRSKKSDSDSSSSSESEKERKRD